MSEDKTKKSLTDEQTTDNKAENTLTDEQLDEANGGILRYISPLIVVSCVDCGATRTLRSIDTSTRRCPKCGSSNTRKLD
jgi:ribosomal protein S27E